MNEKSLNSIGGNKQRFIDAHIPIQSVLGDPDLSLDDLDYTYLTQIFRSPDTHTLTVYSEIEHVQHRLTQTRLLSITAKDYRKAALRIMNSMDNLTQQPVKAVVKSTISISRHTSQTANSQQPTAKHPLYLYFSFVPVKDADGNITEYFGLCRDISDIKATEEQLALETKKAQEVETVKNSFLRNMCYVM